MDFRTLGKWGYAAEAAFLLFLALSSFYSAGTFTSTPSGAPTTVVSRLVSYLTIAAAAVPGALVGFGWFGAGRGGRSTLFKVTGVFGLLTALGGAGLALWVGSGFLTSGLSPPTTSLVLTSTGASAQVPTPQFLGAILTLFLIGATVGILAFCFLIMEIVSFFTAKGVFGVQYFRYAGWGRIIAIVAGAIIFVAVFFSAIIASLSTTNPTPTTFLAQWFSLAYGAALLVWAIPDVVAAFAFRGIPSPEQLAAPAPTPV